MKRFVCVMVAALLLSGAAAFALLTTEGSIVLEKNSPYLRGTIFSQPGTGLICSISAGLAVSLAGSGS
jgi:hypothetical protein